MWEFPEGAAHVEKLCDGAKTQKNKDHPKDETMKQYRVLKSLSEGSKNKFSSLQSIATSGVVATAEAGRAFQEHFEKEQVKIGKSACASAVDKPKRDPNPNQRGVKDPQKLGKRKKHMADQMCF